jgi:hypothetical protein
MGKRLNNRFESAAKMVEDQHIQSRHWLSIASHWDNGRDYGLEYSSIRVYDIPTSTSPIDCPLCDLGNLGPQSRNVMRLSHDNPNHPQHQR